MHHDDKDRLLGRREFTSATVMALLAGVTVTITGCSSDGGNENPMNPSNPGSGGSQGVTPSFSNDHGHTGRITGAELSAGNAVTVQIGGSDHPHTVSLSAAEVMQIAGGQQVAKASSSDNSALYGPHAHTATFN